MFLFASTQCWSDTYHYVRIESTTTLTISQNSHHSNGIFIT